MEDFVTTTGSEIKWRYSRRDPLIDYAAAEVELSDGKAIKLIATDKAAAWRKRASLSQQFRLRGTKVKTRCNPQDDGTYAVIVAKVA
jgi:endonuclease YncB( thermonuclease family)